MVLLGDRFPEYYKNKKLEPGVIIYTYCPFTTPSKDKYHLVCCCDPLLVLLINSEISEFIACRPTLKACQVEISKEEHPFLDWNSFVNCIDAHSAYDISFFKKQCESNFDSFYRGNISPNCIRDVIIAVNRSPTMIPKHKKVIAKELNMLLTCTAI